MVATGKEFLEKHYIAQLTKVKMHNNFLIIDFIKLATFNPELADAVLEDYLNTQTLFEVAANQFEGVKGIKIRFKNIVSSQYRQIWKLRKDDIDQLIVVKGFLRKISDVIHGVSIITWECPACGAMISVLQDKTLKKPSKCGCGRERGFRVVSREIYDLQKLVLEEDPQELQSSTQKPRRIMISLKNDLCRHDIDKNLQPSYKIQVTGILKDIPIKANSSEHKKYIEAEHIDLLDESYQTVKFSNEEVTKFNEIAESITLYDDMSQSIFPTIFGHLTAKLAIFLQLIGGVHISSPEGLFEERGTIHILLVASPGTAKTQMLRKAIQYLPNSRFTGGRGTSGVGLVAAVVKDEEMGGYTLEAGAMPMANKSMLAIDELDKIDKQDIAMMNNAMVDLCVNIDKANIHGVLATDTTVLGAANPINRVFDNKEPIWKQIGLPKDFLDRFDLVFPLENIKSEESQRKVASIIFSKYSKSEKTKPKYPVSFVKKYIAYARQYIEPKLNTPVEIFITNNFVNLIKPGHNIDEDEQAYFSTRLLTNIIRLSTAAAKARLSNTVGVEDAKIAIDVLIDSLRQQQIINSQGLLDIEKCEAIMPKKKRDARYILKEIIEDLCKKSKDNLARDSDVLDVATKQHEFEEDFVDEMVKKMLLVGDITEPQVCKYRLLK